MSRDRIRGRWQVYVLAGFGVALIAQTAAAQQPSQAQIGAVRSACRSDYMANCSSVQPGGPEALQCLQRNSAKLSAGCRQAVGAIGGGGGEAPPPAASQPVPGSNSASAPGDEAPPAGGSAPPPSSRSSGRPPAGTMSRQAPPPPAGAMAPPPGSPPPPATAALPPPGAPMPPLRPRVELMVLRSCATERQTMCDMPPGGGRIIACLVANEASVSPRCAGALAYARTN